MDIIARLEQLKTDLDALTDEVETLADGERVSPQAYNQHNTLTVYLQEARRSLRAALKTARSLD